MNFVFRKQAYEGKGAYLPKRRGSLLVESSLAIVMLIVIGITVLRSSNEALKPRKWSIMQTYTDAYLTQEVAIAKRLDWEVITADDSPWQLPAAAVPVTEIIGRMPTHLVDGNGDARTDLPNQNLEAQVLRTWGNPNGVRSSDFTTDAAGNEFHVRNPDKPVNLDVRDFKITLIYEFDGKTYTKTRIVRRHR